MRRRRKAQSSQLKVSKTKVPRAKSQDQTCYLIIRLELEQRLTGKTQNIFSFFFTKAHAQYPVWGKAGVSPSANIVSEFLNRDKGFVAEFYCHATRRSVERNYTHCLSKPPQASIREKVFDRSRNTSVTILGFITDTGECLFIPRRRNSLVGTQALPHIIDVIFGNRDVYAEI